MRFGMLSLPSVESLLKLLERKPGEGVIPLKSRQRTRKNRGIGESMREESRAGFCTLF